MALFGIMGTPGSFKKGHTGRPKGTPNKLSKSVRETVLEVFNKMQEEGGPASLANWAKDEPTEFYRIAAKLIPMGIKADVQTVQKITLNIVRTNPKSPLTGATQQSAEGTE